MNVIKPPMGNVKSFQWSVDVGLKLRGLASNTLLDPGRLVHTNIAETTFFLYILRVG